MTRGDRFMEFLAEFIQEYNIYIFLGLVISWLFLFFSLIINQRRIKKLQKKYDYFMGNSEGKQLEEVMINYLKKVEDTLEGQEILNQKYAELEYQLGYCIQKVGVIRYNPFEEMGGNFCFAIALLDEFDNGVVMNGILSREGSYTYAKPIEKGQSSYTLSAEEVQALDKAKSQGYRS